MDGRLNLPDLEILVRMLASIIILEHTALRGIASDTIPRLTLGCNPMPCLSRTPIGPFGSVCRQWGRVPITETILV